MAGCFRKVVQKKGFNVLAYDQTAASPPRFFLKGGALPPFTRRPPNTVPKLKDLPCSYITGTRLVLDQKESSNPASQKKWFLESYGEL